MTAAAVPLLAAGAARVIGVAVAQAERSQGRRNVPDSAVLAAIAR
jgi:hypothetical protein